MDQTIKLEPWVHMSSFKLQTSTVLLILIKMQQKPDLLN